jgi:hypothetical protein
VVPPLLPVQVSTNRFGEDDRGLVTLARAAACFGLPDLRPGTHLLALLVLFEGRGGTISTVSSGSVGAAMSLQAGCAAKPRRQHAETSLD